MLGCLALVGGAGQPTMAHAADDTPADAETPSYLQLSMFVDAYAAWQTGGEGTLATLSNHRLFSGQGATLRAENGFSLAFLGFDARYDDGHIGAVASLRFGEAARIYHYKSDDSDFAFGVDHIYEAYALWRPHVSVELDGGLFLSPFGVESYESWRNPNYTRGAVANYAQPTWHTGLRAKWQPNEQLTLLGFVANGSNNVSETQERSGLDQSPTVGAQLAYVPNGFLSLALGGLVALDGKNNGDSGYDGFADVVGTLHLAALTASLNGDLIVTRAGAPSGDDRYCWGLALFAAYELTDHLALGGRGEYVRDDASYGAGDVWELVTGTLTFDVKIDTPAIHAAAASPLLVLRWENRWEKSNQDVFGKDNRGTEDVADDLYTDSWFESVIGVVFTTAP
jgi:putative OmpL-like beta-barrel porin-2